MFEDYAYVLNSNSQFMQDFPMGQNKSKIGLFLGHSSIHSKQGSIKELQKGCK